MKDRKTGENLRHGWGADKNLRRAALKYKQENRAEEERFPEKYGKGNPTYIAKENSILFEKWSRGTN